MKRALPKKEENLKATDKILDFSDSEDKREDKSDNKKKTEEDSSNSSLDYDRQDSAKKGTSDNKIGSKALQESQSVDDVSSMQDYNTKKVEDRFKESHDSSYPEDFENSASHNESSSKFGASAELAKNILSAAKKEELKSPEKTPAKEDTKPEFTVSPITNFSNNIVRADSKGVENKTSTNVAANYETRAAKDYVYESLINDEKRRAVLIEQQLATDNGELKTLKKLLEDKDANLLRAEATNIKLQRELDEIKGEHSDASKNLVNYRVENEELVKKVDVLEAKLLQLESDKRVL
jgi:hypothetical protein